MDVPYLYNRYKRSIQDIIKIVQTNNDTPNELLAASIISKLTLEILPLMMKDVGQLTNLSGEDKKKTIVDSLKYALTDTFKELNKIPALSKAKWDELLLSALLSSVPATIDLLIKVEGSKLVFNKKISSCGCF